MDSPTAIKRVKSVYSDSIDGVSIRLLQFSLSEDLSEEGVFVGKLQTFPLASAPHFCTVSYVWGDVHHSRTTIQMETGDLPVLDSLVPFLHMVTQHDDFDPKQWWWIDSLCINLTDGHEREEQVRIMAEIYKRARRAVIWLGREIEPGSDCTGAIGFLHYLARLQVASKIENMDYQSMRMNLDDPQFSANCTAISNLLFRPWWTRVWTLQEFVLPKEAKLYCGMKSISRGRFKSALYSIFLCSTISNDFEHEFVPRKAFDGAFNRRRIHQLHTKPGAKGLSLIALMALLGNHSATDSRDRIFSVLGLITNRDRKLIGSPEYTHSTELQFARLVKSFWDEYMSLDIICFVHLFSRYSVREDPGFRESVPWWTPDWRAMTDFSSPVPLMVSQPASEHIGNFRPLKFAAWKAVYDAPGSDLRKKADVQFSVNLQELWCNGVVLGTICALGGLDDRDLRCQSFVCAQDGHFTILSATAQRQVPKIAMDWIEAVTYSLVLGRQDKYLCFYATQDYLTDFLTLCHGCIEDEPVDWSFSTWFNHNRRVVFGDQTLEDLVRSVPPFHHPASAPLLRRTPPVPLHLLGQAKPDKLDTFLSRFHDTVRKKARRLMVIDDGIVGMAPCRARDGDIVAILFGCSIPLVLRNRGKEGGREGWQLIGEAYAHDYMNGEVLNLITEERRSIHRFRLI